MPVRAKVNDVYPDERVGWLLEELPREFRRAVEEGRKPTGMEIKKYLKRLFPKFRGTVRTAYYSGGSSLYITIKGGAGVEEVRKALTEFEGRVIDGAIDYCGSRYQSVIMPDGSVKEFDFWGFVHVDVDTEVENRLLPIAEREIAKRYGVTVEDIRRDGLRWQEVLRYIRNVLIKEV